MRKGQFKTVKTASAVLLLTLALLAPYISKVPIAKAGSQTVVKVDPSTSFANVSATFTINITIVDVQDLYAVEVTLSWNSSVLTVANIDSRLGQADGVLYGSPFIAQNSTQPGKYSLAATSVGPAPPFNGSGTIVKITFKVTGPGNSELGLESQLYNYNPPNISMPIDHTTVSGFFGPAIPEIPSGFIAIMFLILTVFAIVLSNVTQKRGQLHSRLENCRQSGQYLTLLTKSNRRSAG